MKHEKKNPRAARAPNLLEKKALGADRNRAGSGEHAEEEIEREATDAGFVDPEADPSESSPEPKPALVRLNKYLADHGIASRRKCDELIAAGQVTVDGNVSTELGQCIDPSKHTVEIDGFILKPRGLRRRYYLLNKPSGVVCTNEPRETRPRAVDLITDARKGRIYTVGRLDEESKGLILLTNDGDFANRIMHPRYGVEKTYLVRVAGKIDDEALTKIREGVHLSEGRTAGARILVNTRLRDQSTLTLTLREGMNREIRRSFAHVGYKVLDLRRTRIGPLSERGIKIGRWRELTRDEVEALSAGRNESLDARERQAGDGRFGQRRSRNLRDGKHRKGEFRGGKHSGPGPGEHAGRAGDRRPKVRSGWRVFEERARSHDEKKHGAGRIDQGHSPALRGFPRPGRDAHPAGRGARPAGREARLAGRGARPADRDAHPADRDARPAGRDAHPAGRGARPAGREARLAGRGAHPAGRGAARDARGNRRDERGHGAPPRAGGGPGAHTRMQKSMRDRRPPKPGTRSSSHSGRTSFGKRSGKPASRGANRRG